MNEATKGCVARSIHSNRPFPCCLKPPFQNEAKCEVIDMKMIFIHANKTYFHKKVLHFARLVLKVRVLGTGKWPVYGHS